MSHYLADKPISGGDFHGLFAELRFKLLLWMLLLWSLMDRIEYFMWKFLHG